MTPTLTTCNSHRAGRLADFILEHGRELAAQCGKLKRLRLWADLTLRPPIEEAVSQVVSKSLLERLGMYRVCVV